MTYLLDTHYLLWSLADTGKLSAFERDLITHPDNEIAVSIVSFWEISLKDSICKLTLKGFSPEDLSIACAEMRFTVITLNKEESSSFHQLRGAYLKDPFDRMLVWQAICNDFTLISADKHIRKYTSAGLKILQAKA